jgi:hypothetical protein
MNDEMNPPSVTIVGVHEVALTPEGLREAFVAEYGEYGDHLPPPEEFVEQYGERLSLIEIAITPLPPTFDVGGITQEEAGLARASWQVPFDEKWLDQSGIEEVAAPEAGSLARFAFFFHLTQLDKPLITPLGSFALPPVTPMPDRLRSLFRYVPP